jgi:DNA-binding NtrC family response regulator
MPGISGLDLQENLFGLGIHLPVILMTGHADVPISVRGMKAGAVDFLTEPFCDHEMLDAIATAIGRAATQRQPSSVFAKSSPRCRRESGSDASRHLGLSEITVKIHRGAAMRILGAVRWPTWCG